jgi:uncharacterized protein YndB with AHSA1/START domain
LAKTAEEAVVRKSVRVQGSIERAFSIFVEQMETWWPAEHHIGKHAFQCIVVEPRVGGRWYERDAQGSECNWGSVLAWEPPQRVTLGWHLQPDWKFDPDPTKASEVEIRFTAKGPSSTQVDLEHIRGLPPRELSRMSLSASLQATYWMRIRTRSGRVIAPTITTPSAI